MTSEDRSKYGEMVEVYFRNESRRISCGTRLVYAKYGRKWVTLTYFKGDRVKIRVRVHKEHFEKMAIRKEIAE